MRALGIIFSNIHDSNVPELVSNRTVGSIPFGGRYRLIDFILSNMVNSDIYTVGVITKRNYQSLMDHVGSGKDWDLARKDGGLIFLPPYSEITSDSLYTSRLNALKSIMNFLERADEEYVVLSDCDCVCRVNYADVIDKHIASKSDITMIYTKFDGSTTETSVNTIDMDANGRVENVKYHEVLSEKANLFMNMYVIKRTLLANLVKESISRKTRHFIDDVVLKNIKVLKINGYEHKGHYARISSLQAYFDNSMKLLDNDVRNELFGDRSVFTKIRDSAPTKYGNNAIVKNSMIADGCEILGEVENSILFRGVKVARGTKVKNCILMQNTVIGENASLNCIIADKNVVVRDRINLSGAENHTFYIPKGSMI